MLDCFGRDARRSQTHIRFQRSGEQKRILQHDAEVLAQFLHIEQPYVHAVQQNLPALNVVKAQQQRDQRGFPGSRVSHDREVLPRFDAERNIAQHPVFVLRFFHVAVREPHVAELDFSARRNLDLRIRICVDGDGLVQQLENSFGCGHRRLQDVEFLAQVLDGPEEALGEHGELDQNAEREGVAQNPVSAGPVDERDGRKTQEFHRRIEQRVRQNRVAPRQHVVLVAF